MNPHHLAGEPHALGRKEIPLETTGILIRAGELSEHLRAPGIQHECLGDDELARRQLEAVVASNVNDVIMRAAKSSMRTPCLNMSILRQGAAGDRCN